MKLIKKAIPRWRRDIFYEILKDFIMKDYKLDNNTLSAFS